MALARRLDEQRLTIDWHQTPLVEALDQLAGQVGADLYLGLEAKDLLDGEGLVARLRIADLRARSALELLLMHPELVYRLRGGRIEVLSLGEVDEPLWTLVYDVRDVLSGAAAARGGCESLDHDTLVELIQYNVLEDDRSGEQSVDVTPAGRLIARLPAEGHGALRRLLGLLRGARPAIPPSSPPPYAEVLWGRLAEATSRIGQVDLTGLTLRETVDLIRERSGVDRIVIWDDVDDGLPGALDDLKLSQGSLKDVLRLVARRLDLIVVPQSECLVLRQAAAWSEGQRYVQHAFDLRPAGAVVDRLTLDLRSDRLGELVSAGVGSDSWDGAASVRCVGGLLLVTQTPRKLREIEVLLRKMKRRP